MFVNLSGIFGCIRALVVVHFSCTYILYSTLMRSFIDIWGTNLFYFSSNIRRYLRQRLISILNRRWQANVCNLLMILIMSINYYRRFCVVFRFNFSQRFMNLLWFFCIWLTPISLALSWTLLNIRTLAGGILNRILFLLFYNYAFFCSKTKVIFDWMFVLP